MQIDIRTLLENSRWKQNEGLIIPAYLTRTVLSVTDVSTAVYITYEDVLGKKYTKEELKQDLSQLSIEDCIILTSRILTLLENEGYNNETAQRGITHELFTGEIKDRILSILYREPKRVVFFETQLLLVTKYAMLYAKNEPANDFMQGELFSVFAKVVLGMTDLLEEVTGGTNIVELQRAAIRNMYFNSKPNFLYSVIRVEDLFINIPDELTLHHQYLDIPSLFKEATGLTLESYLLLGTSLMTFLTQQKPGKTLDTNWYIIPESFFQNTLVSKEEIELLMKEFSINVENLITVFKDQESFEYNFGGLVQHPLVTYNKSAFFPLDLSFLKDKITLQVYWILFDYIDKAYGNKKLSDVSVPSFNLFFHKYTESNEILELPQQKTTNSQDVPLSRYTNFMGICFEEYVYRLLRRIYPTSSRFDDRLVREFVYKPKKTEVKTVDNIVIYSSSLILIETKVSQLNVYQTGIVGDLDAFRKDIRKIVVKAFRTIQRTKEDFQSGLLKQKLSVHPQSIKTFYPVIVTYGKFIMFPIVWRIIEEEIQKEVPNYDTELLNNLQIIQADEIEAIEAFLSTRGMSFETLLRMKLMDQVFKSLPFHNYLNYEFKQEGRLISTYQEQQFDHFTDKLMLKILGHIRPKR